MTANNNSLQILNYDNEFFLSYNKEGGVDKILNSVIDKYALDEIRLVRFIIILNGTMELTANNNKHTVYKNTFVEIIPALMEYKIEVSEDFLFYEITSTEHFNVDTLLGSNPIPMTHIEVLRNNPAIVLDSNELELLLDIYKRIEGYLLSESHAFRKELIHNSYYIFLLELANIIIKREKYTLKHTDANANLSRKNSIIRDFMNLLNEHGKKEHAPSFYANKLCISTQYLSLILKEISKSTAGDWISSHLITQAKILLRTKTSSIQEISDELYFSDQASFGKFFKKHTGISPKKYRESSALL